MRTVWSNIRINKFYNKIAPKLDGITENIFFIFYNLPKNCFQCNNAILAEQKIQHYKKNDFELDDYESSFSNRARVLLPKIA